VVEIPLQIQN